MSDCTAAEDATLLAQLDVSASSADSWSQLVALAAAFATFPHDEDDFRWVHPPALPDGSIAISYLSYGDRVMQARNVLAEVGAVTAAYDWMRQPASALPVGETPLSPADAVRVATASIRGERFCDGTIANALAAGSFQAALAALTRWYHAKLEGPA
jgi:hypothetical protein